MYEWTLNWNEIRHDLVVGSCPMTPADIERIHEGANATAILSLQHPECWSHHGIDYGALCDRASSLGLVTAHAPMRDFDSGDQERHLPRAVRRLKELISGGHRVYVHCTAGINRAPLTVLGYLAFAEGMLREDAFGLIKGSRALAEPDWSAFDACRRHLLADREHDVRERAYERSQRDPVTIAEKHWVHAEGDILRRSFT